MKKSGKQDCLFFSGGACTSDNISEFRGDDCRNESKSTCCYTCALRDQCEVRCDLLDLVEKTALQTEGRGYLKAEERIKAGYDILLRFYAISGVLLLAISIVWFHSLTSGGYSYLDIIQTRWQAYLLARSSSRFFDFLSTLAPFFLVAVGPMLIVYATLRLRTRKTR